MRPGGVRAVAAESLLLKHQLLILNRSPQKSLTSRDMGSTPSGFRLAFRSPQTHSENCGRLKPSTFLRFHQALTKLKYHQLYASGCRRRPGPKGFSRELIAAMVEMKHRNPVSAVQGLRDPLA
jgi:hypothetical protein